jgi:hypothetical protein
VSTVLYEHLPEEIPDGWVQSNYVSATHYHAWQLFNTRNEFSDVFRRYLSLKETTTALVRACSIKIRPLAATRKDERDALLQRRAVFMGSDDQPGGNWDARIRSWLAISDSSSASEPLVFYKNPRPIKRESLEELMWRLGLQPYELPTEGWVGRNPYHAAERNWRQGDGKLPTRLPQELRDKLLKPLREEVPELKDLKEEELAGVLYLLKANPPYPMSRKKDLSQLTDEQRARVKRETELQLTRVLTQLFAAREARALRMLHEVLEEGLDN